MLKPERHLQSMVKHPDKYKRYSSFEDLMDEVLADA